MTKIRYQYEEGNRGLIVLECSPQKRTINVNGKFKTLCFPYIVFVISYTKNKQGEFIYHGLSGNGFQVYFNNKPLKSLHDIVHISPTDINGYVCTDHAYDGTIYKNLKLLAKAAMGLWWRVRHDIGCCSMNDRLWLKEKSLENVFNFKWDTLYYRDKEFSLLEMMTYTSKVVGYSFCPKRAKRLSNKDWV